MDTIAIECPNGHRLTGSADLVGRKVRCPKCAVTFQLHLPERKTLTETGVMRLLGDVTPVPTPPDPEAQAHARTKRACPRCHELISVHANVCDHCKCYVGVMPHFLAQMIEDGKSVVGYKHQH